MGVCNCSMFCCTLLYIHSSIAITLMGKRELIALLNLSSWCFVMVERLFLAMPRGCLQFVIVVFPDHTHLLFSIFRRNCTSFEKNEFENFSILILMPYLSQTFESYQRVKMYTYSVKYLGLKIFFYSNMVFTGISQFADRTLCHKNRILRSVL